jgi:hypothetical protein
MALGSYNESVGFFRVDMSHTAPTDFAVQWGANPAEYIEAQNQLGSLGCIEKSQDTLYVYAAEDKLVHEFGFECVDSDDCEHRLDNYTPGKTTLDAVIDFSKDCNTIAYKNGTSAITFASPTFRSDFPEIFTVTNLKSNAGAVLTDNDDSFLLWAPKDGFNLIGKKSGEAEALAGHCKGQVVEMSWPWGWPTKNNLFVVITRLGKNTFVANRYDATAQTCKAGYTFTFEPGWAGGDDDAADGSITFSWMDSIHALVVLTKDRLFYALPGEGPAVPTTVVDLTKKIGTPVSSIFGLKAWQY